MLTEQLNFQACVGYFFKEVEEMEENGKELDYKYGALVAKLLSDGDMRGDRTGTGTWSLFGESLDLDISEYFPLLTLKNTWWHGVLTEFIWMVVKGETNIEFLKKNGVNVWDEWADPDGNLGPIYGKQFRDCDGVDQVAELIKGLKENPLSRRHLLSAWHLPDMLKSKLPCCHGTVVQFYVRGGYLDCQMHQRSADVFLGVPWNIAFYGLFTYVLGYLTGLQPGRLKVVYGDVHLYQNHTNQALEMLRRLPKTSPKLKITSYFEDIDCLDFSCVSLSDYKPYPSISAPIAV